MSVAELTEKINELSPEERSQLFAFLAGMGQQEEAEFREEIGRRMKDMDAGHKVTAEEFERKHNELKARGL
jgi:hypothetical protein